MTPSITLPAVYFNYLNRTRREENTSPSKRFDVVQKASEAKSTTFSRQFQSRQILLEQYEKLKAVNVFAKQVKTFLADDSNWDEDCIRPTGRAQAAIFELLEKVGSSITLPKGIIYPNGQGGLRIEWRNNNKTDEERYILLSVDGFDESKDYAYYQRGNLKGELKTQITAVQLLRQLRWLAGSEK